MAENQLRNFLVLGNFKKDSDANIPKFIKLFGDYLEYESFEEAKKWQPNITYRNYGEGLENSVIITENNKMNLLSTENMYSSCNSKVLFSILPYFEKEEKLNLNGIIAFLGPIKEDYIRLQKLISSVFPQFNENNIIYVILYNQDLKSCHDFVEELKHGTEMNVSPQQYNNILFLDFRFYRVCNDNWLESVKISKNIDYYIAEHLKKSQSYIWNIPPEKPILQLIDDLLELLNIVYICATNYIPDGRIYHLLYINDYRTTTTTCYGNCADWKKIQSRCTTCKIKIPQLCHGPCKCTKFDNDISKCKFFENNICLRCKCKLEFHSRNEVYIETKSMYQLEPEELRCDQGIAINVLATFHLYKKQNQETYNVVNNFRKFLDLQENDHKLIDSNFQKEFIEEVTRMEKKNTLITYKEILYCVNKLWKLKYVVGINIQAVIGEIIPQEFRLKMVMDIQIINVANPEFVRKKIDEDKEKIQKLRNQITEIEGEINRILNGISPPATNDLNSELNQDEQSSTDNINLN